MGLGMKNKNVHTSLQENLKLNFLEFPFFALLNQEFIELVIFLKAKVEWVAGSVDFSSFFFLVTCALFGGCGKVVLFGDIFGKLYFFFSKKIAIFRQYGISPKV